MSQQKLPIKMLKISFLFIQAPKLLPNCSITFKLKINKTGNRSKDNE